MIEYREDLSREPGDYYYKHTYIYNGHVIETDTVRSRQGGQLTEVRNIHYDVNGRVIKEDSRIIERDYLPVDEEWGSFEYAYDAAVIWTAKFSLMTIK